MKMIGIKIRLIQTPPPHAGGELWYTTRIGASSDTELFKNHRSTICFWDRRIATCLYRTPMGSRV